MKRRFIKIIGILMMFCIAVMLTACSEAEMVNYNMSKQADYFECERKITVYNARTDNIAVSYTHLDVYKRQVLCTNYFIVGIFTIACRNFT